MVEINNIKKVLKTISKQYNIEIKLVLYYKGDIEIKMSDEKKFNKIKNIIKKNIKNIKNIKIYKGEKNGK